MREKDHAAAVAKLKTEPRYGPMFQRAFGSPDITMERIENAVASFERTLLSGNSAFDRYEYGGDKAALTPAQVQRPRRVSSTPTGATAPSATHR